MHTYQRDGQFLVVVDHIPQWFIVDDIGHKIVTGILAGRSLNSICHLFREDLRKEVKKTYQALKPLITQEVDRTLPMVENALTTKTTVAMISVTRNCNLKSICPHCYVDATGSRDTELTVDDHHQLAGELRACLATGKHVYKVNLTGGEPFIRKDILKIIRAYHGAGFQINMSTNGMLILKRNMGELSDMNVTLSVSLDGSTVETHDRIRGHGSWLRVVSTIRELVNSGIRVGINFLVHKGNFHEFESVITFAHELGCSGFNPINLVQLGRACDSGLQRVSEVEIFQRLIRHLKLHPEQKNLFAASSLFSSLGSALLAGITCESCGVGNRPCVYIDEVGSVYPCPNTQRPEFCLGNIRQQSLVDCVHLDHPVLKTLRGLQVSTLNSKCSQCDVRYFCGGDCRGETYNVTGDLYSPYVACQDRHNSIIELMWIVAENEELFEGRAEEYIINLH